MTTAYKMPPIPEPIDMDSDSGEGGRGGAIWHTTDDLIAYAAPLGEEIARLQAQVDALADALQACIRSNERWSLTPGRTNAIAAARAALAAVGR